MLFITKKYFTPPLCWLRSHYKCNDPTVHEQLGVTELHKEESSQGSSRWVCHSDLYIRNAGLPAALPSLEAVSVVKEMRPGEYAMALGDVTVPPLYGPGAVVDTNGLHEVRIGIFQVKARIPITEPLIRVAEKLRSRSGAS